MAGGPGRYAWGKEAQTQVAKQGTIPVREDVALPNKHFDLLKPVLSWKKAMKVNFTEAVKTKENTIKKFTEILQFKK